MHYARFGKSHQNAKFLSRINDTINPESVDDNFSDAHIFTVKDRIDVMDIIPAEYADIIYYLTKRRFCHNYTRKEKSRLAHRGQFFTMIEKVLYKRGHDDVLRRCLNPSEVPMI